MLEYAKRKAGRTFDHPILGLLLILAGLSLLVGLALDPVLNNPVAVGFMGVFAVYFAALALLGYLILLGAKALSIIRDRTASYL